MDDLCGPPRAVARSVLRRPGSRRWRRGWVRCVAGSAAWLGPLRGDPRSCRTGWRWGGHRWAGPL